MDSISKILFTDMDGTLLNDASHISDCTKKTIKRMTDAGHKLVLSSGRPLDSIMGVVNAEGIEKKGLYIAANNGSTIYDCDADKIILKKTVPMDMVNMVWNHCIENGIHIQTYTSNSIVTVENDAEIKVYTSRIFLPVIYTNNPKEVLTEEPYKLLAINLEDKSVLDELKDYICDNYGDRITAIFSNDRYLEVINATSGKGAALTWLCDYLGIDANNSYGAGDAMNDLSMIEAAGHGIAMCNGDAKLFESAEIISDKTNDEDGLADIIDRLII